MKAFDKIAVLGGGAFGVALSKIASSQADQVFLWARDKKICSFINSHNAHPDKLSNIKFPKSLRATSNLEEALLDARVVIFCVPMQALLSVLEQAREFMSAQAIVVSTAKGITPMLELSCDIINKTLEEEAAERACYLSGPSFARELAEGLPTALTLASLSRDSALEFQHGFSKKNLRLYYSDDIIGVCVGGALKNVVAIAAGACAGLGLGRNALASLITRGLAEMTRLAKSMGGHAETLSGLSGMGDLVLSCTDNMSRNYRLGALLAQGLNLQEAVDQIGSVVEGAKTAQAIGALMRKYDLEMPISDAVYHVLYKNIPLSQAMSALLKRVLKDERIS